MKIRWICTALLLLSAGVFCTSCAGRTKTQMEDTYTVGVVTKSSTSEYWMSLCEGVKSAAEEFGMEVIILQPDSETDTEAQIKMMETLVKKKVDIIAVSPIDSQNSAEYLKTAEAAGIPVISYDDSFDSGEIPYIGIDNEKAGYELMKYMAEQMDHQGEVGIISGPLSQRCHCQRIEGAGKYLEEEPDMTLSYVESGYSNLRMKEEEVVRLLEEYPAVKGVMITSGATAMGFAEAVSGKNIKIVSLDTQTDALKALKKGSLTALMAQSGYDMGYETIRYIEKLRKQDDGGLQNQETAGLQKPEMEKKQKLIETRLLTPDNVDEYMQSEESPEQMENTGE